LLLKNLKAKKPDPKKVKMKKIRSGGLRGGK
jgi:hypothetical protein